MKMAIKQFKNTSAAKGMKVDPDYRFIEANTLTLKIKKDTTQFVFISYDGKKKYPKGATIETEVQIPTNVLMGILSNMYESGHLKFNK